MNPEDLNNAADSADHRRTMSDLNTLMQEQLNLQRQLELVQQQQQQILQMQQQQQYQQFPSATVPVPVSQPAQSFGSGVFGQFTAAPVSMPPPSSIPKHITHKKSSSIESEDKLSPPPGLNRSSHSHRRAQSSINAGSMGSFQMGYAPAFKPTPVDPPAPASSGASNSHARGHSRRHSLGLNEARRAAAMVQMQRAGDSPPKVTPTNTGPPAFKFPADPEEPSDLQRQPSHTRSRSALPSMERSPQRSFQFPPRESAPSSNLLVPPNPNFAGHRRRQSGNNFGSSGSINNNSGNWRKQHTPQNSEGGSGFVQGHRSRFSYGGSVSSMASFNSNAGGNGPQRKNLFTNYLPQSSLSELISEGRLVVGTLRVNKKNRSDAYVSTDGVLDADIFICGSKDRNRSLEGDLVAVELLVVDEVWNSKKEKEEKKRRKNMNSNNSQPQIEQEDVHNDAATSYTGSAGSREDGLQDGSSKSLTRRGSLKQRPTQKKNDDVEVEGQSLLLVEEEEISDEYKPLYAGQVVAIVERTPGQCFSGTLMVNRPSQQNFSPEDLKRLKIVWFKPTDKKVPLIAIPVEQVPKDFLENEKKYANQIFVGLIKRWPISSLHPFGNLVSQIGPMNDPETEVSTILCDNNFMSDEYSESNPEKTALLMKDVPDPSLSLVSQAPTRRDFTQEYVIACSQTGSFSDHALHVKRISDTKIELGVHLTDISFYVKQDSYLDKQAKKRSHSVFLPQRAVHLYPAKVNDMVSLRENEKSLTMSVVFAIDTSNFEIEQVWMGEAIVCPKQKVNYESIDFILGKSVKGPKLESFSSATADYIRTFSLIAREFKRKRLQNPRLDNEPSLPLIDQLDDEKVKLSLNIFDTSPSTSMIDEIFHTVNAAVAQRIHAGLGDRALLRRYAPPTLQKLETYHKKIANLGVELDTTSSATLLNSLLAIKDPVTRMCIETILIKCLARGKYFVAGTVAPENAPHYLFNLPVYTHFTAPMRRYADLVVHRQLKAVIKNEAESYSKDVHSLKEVADFCNFKKDCAKNAQEQAIHLILCQTINDMSQATGHLLCMGIVIQVYESAFDVFLPEFGIEKRVHGDQLPLRKAEFDKKSRVLELFWEKGVDSATYVPPDENEPLSYRNSVKNKFRSAALDVAKVQNKAVAEKSDIITETFSEKLAKLGLVPPKINVPGNDDSTTAPPIATPKSMPNTPVRPNMPKQNSAPLESELVSPSESPSEVLAPYLKSCITRVDGDNYIQEIRELKAVPILLRAEIGMALPCLTVRTLNPFSRT